MDVVRYRTIRVRSADRSPPLLAARTASVPPPRINVPHPKVYDQIIADLKAAIILLPEAYDPAVHPEDYQDRAKQAAARFLLAKVYFL